MKKEDADKKRTQINARVDAKVVQGVRLVAAARRSKEWTQDLVIETALRFMFGTGDRDVQSKAKEFREMAKNLSLSSFNSPDLQSDGFVMA